jgi:hypothetical protein
MAWKLRDYLEEVMDAIENKEGATLASLLSVTALDNRQRIAQAFRANPQVRQILRRWFDQACHCSSSLTKLNLFVDRMCSNPRRLGLGFSAMVTREIVLYILADIDEG